MNIYVGNLSPEVTKEDLRHASESFGQVTSVSIVKDRFSGAIFYNVKIPTVDHTDLNPTEVIKTSNKVTVNGGTGVVEVL